MIRTIKVWCRYDPKKHTIAGLHRKKRFVKPRSGCVILQLKGICAVPRNRP